MGWAALPGTASPRRAVALTAFLSVALLGQASPALAAEKPASVASDVSPLTQIRTGASLLPGCTYHPVGPKRIFDTRWAGSTGALRSGSSTSFQITGSAGVPAGAKAVTGTLTIARPTYKGFVSISPVSNTASSVSTSTVNVTTTDPGATDMTMLLDPDGKIWALYYTGRSGDRVHLLFDISGYFSEDPAGATFHPLGPIRALDTLTDPSGPAPLVSEVPTSFQVGGSFGVPADAIAITGTLTISSPSRAGFVAVTPLSRTSATVSTSTISFAGPDTRAIGMTMPLGPDGKIWALYWTGQAGDTVHVALDIAGYFSNDPAGATFHPAGPVRVVDTRSGVGTSGAFIAGVPKPLPVSGAFGIPAGAVAVTATLTIANPSRSGYLVVKPSSFEPAPELTSTINFGTTDPLSTGITMALDADGRAWAAYQSGHAGDTVHVILDVSGYFAVDPPELQPLPLYPLGRMPLSNSIYDAQGVKLVDYGGTLGIQYNPVTIAQGALDLYQRWQTASTPDEQKALDRKAFFAQIDWLVRNQDAHGLWLYHFKIGHQPLPWWSAMAQGLAISALLRAYSVTGDETYLPVIARARATFERDVSDFGVHMRQAAPKGKSVLVYEEYMPGATPNVLNGWMYSVIGLFEAAVYLDDPLAAFDVYAADRGLGAIRTVIGLYDTGNWSLYYQTALNGYGYGTRARLGYHQIHVTQLRYFGTLTRNPILLRYAARFESYIASCASIGTC